MLNGTTQDTCWDDVNVMTSDFVFNLTIVDTPGFGSIEAFKSMVSKLKMKSNVLDKFFLLLEPMPNGVNVNVERMLHTYQDAFGSTFWKNTILIVTKWNKLGSGTDSTLLSYTLKLNLHLVTKLQLNMIVPILYMDSIYNQSGCVKEMDILLQTDLVKKNKKYDLSQAKEVFQFKSPYQLKNYSESETNMFELVLLVSVLSLLLLLLTFLLVLLLSSFKAKALSLRKKSTVVPIIVTDATLLETFI